MLKRKKGFTLIELLIVVAIVGILAALLIPNAIAAMQKAKQKGTMKDIQTIATALTDYITDNGVAPINTGEITNELQTSLSALYLKICPLEDQWGNPLQVNSGQVDLEVRGITFAGNDDFVVESWGRNGESENLQYSQADPEAGMYVVQSMTDFNNDLVVYNGSWIIGPVTRSGAST